MTKRELPRFIIYQANQKEFHICLEVKGKFLRWCSYYLPSMDVRFPREVNKISDIPVGKLPSKKVFDQGTYSTTKTDTKELSEKKLLEGLQKKSFAFILNGKNLHGRFAIKKIKGGFVIQKFKDKYAVEEDVLSGDLSRTISTMIPDYDESKVKLVKPRKSKSKIDRQEVQPAQEIVEEITEDKVIGKVAYHFTFYTAEDGSELCLIRNESGEALLFERKSKKWAYVKPNRSAVNRYQDEFIKYIEALSGG